MVNPVTLQYLAANSNRSLYFVAVGFVASALNFGRSTSKFGLPPRSLSVLSWMSLGLMRITMSTVGLPITVALANMTFMENEVNHLAMKVTLALPFTQVDSMESRLHVCW
jgi:hypothetical protein